MGNCIVSECIETPVNCNKLESIKLCYWHSGTTPQYFRLWFRMILGILGVILKKRNYKLWFRVKPHIVSDIDSTNLRASKHKIIARIYG